MTEFFTSSDIFESLPYTILSLGSFVILVLALFWKKKENRKIFRATSLILAFAAFVSIFYIGNERMPMGELLMHDSIGFSFAFTVMLTLMLALVILPYESKSLDEMPSSVISLLLLSSCGALVMIYSNHLLVFFVGLELLSLPLYVLTGLGNKTKQSSEASFKYFLIGSIASAIFIYGASLMWATLGTLQINEITEIFSTRLVDISSATLWLGMILVVVALLFKLGVFPFQFWIPDVYQSAPASIVAWMSGVTKAASIVVLIRLLYALPVSVREFWIVPLSVLSMCSMFWGSVGGLFQTNVRRLLGYSTIAHGGYAMIAVVDILGGAMDQVAPILAFYFLVYSIASLIAFTIVSREEALKNYTLDDYAGFSKRSPVAAVCLALSLLSLAGLPPLGGFLGKFNIFYNAITMGYTSLVLVAVATSLISLGYYLTFLVKIFMEPGDKDFLKVPYSTTTVVICVSSFLLLLLGIYPRPVLDLFLFFVY